MLGPPLIETNQLPDGGTFARLEIADLQDGVTQRYAWGPGTLDVVFNAGKTQLAALRFDEYETYVRGKMLLPCEPQPREAWAKLIGVPLPRKAGTSRMGRGQLSIRYNVRQWTVRLRCAGTDLSCTDASVYLPAESRAHPEPIAVAELPPLPEVKLEKPVRASPAPAPRRRPLRGR